MTPAKSATPSSESTRLIDRAPKPTRRKRAGSDAAPAFDEVIRKAAEPGCKSEQARKPDGEPKAADAATRSDEQAEIKPRKSKLEDEVAPQEPIIERESPDEIVDDSVAIAALPQSTDQLPAAESVVAESLPNSPAGALLISDDAAPRAPIEAVTDDVSETVSDESKVPGAVIRSSELRPAAGTTIDATLIPNETALGDATAPAPAQLSPAGAAARVAPENPAREVAQTDLLIAAPADADQTAGDEHSADQAFDDSTDSDFEAAPWSGPSPAIPRAAAPAPSFNEALGSSLELLDASPTKPPAPVAPASGHAGAPIVTGAVEDRFAADNHEKIITGLRANLLPNGGTMRIRLDPPELGELQVSVHVRDGVLSAAFETASDDATRLLSHSLSQLKHALETQGLSVDKLHVQQSPRNERAGDNEPRQQQEQSGQGQAHDSPARRDHERREMLQRLWRRLRDGSDPLDMVA
jgi:flagellar hook-length control protein FliK